jgi:hypothetical protein
MLLNTKGLRLSGCLNISSETAKTLFGRDRVIPRPITPVFLNKTRSPIYSDFNR